MPPKQIGTCGPGGNIGRDKKNFLAERSILREDDTMNRLDPQRARVREMLLEVAGVALA
jgi:hypothetical protein